MMTDAYIIFLYDKKTLLLLQLVGIGVTAIAAYILVLKDKKISYFVEFLFDPSCLLCLFGSIACAAGFLGCSGSLRENTLLLRFVSILKSINCFVFGNYFYFIWCFIFLEASILILCTLCY